MQEFTIDDIPEFEIVDGERVELSLKQRQEMLSLWQEDAVRIAAMPMEELRRRRDNLLAKTDWWVMPDRTPTEAQIQYRQALRDLPSQYPNLDDITLQDVVWPTKPEGA